MIVEVSVNVLLEDGAWRGRVCIVSNVLFFLWKDRPGNYNVHSTHTHTLHTHTYTHTHTHTTHTSQQLHPLVDLGLVVKDDHGEGVVLPVVIAIEDKAEIPSVPSHLCEVTKGGVESDAFTRFVDLADVRR